MLRPGDFGSGILMILLSACFPGFCHPQLRMATTTPMRRQDQGGTGEQHGPERAARLSVDEAAAITGLSRDLLYDQMRTGKLAYLKVGRRRIITRQHLEALASGSLPRWCHLTRVCAGKPRRRFLDRGQALRRARGLQGAGLHGSSVIDA
jgi:excisionase family DNA binding protein